MGKYTEFIKEHKIILLSVFLLFIILLGYLGLLLYKHLDYEEYSYLYDLYDEDEKSIIIRASINYWIIAAIIVIFVAFVWKKIYDRQQEYRLRSLYSPKKNNENTLNNEIDRPSLNKFTTVCFYIWIFRNLIRVIIQFGYIFNGIDIGIHAYNIIVGILFCILLDQMAKGNKTSLFLFYSLEMINGLIISQIEKDYSSLLFSLFASIFVSLLLLFKNKSGQTGFDVMFRKRIPVHEKNVPVLTPPMSGDEISNQDMSNSQKKQPLEYFKTEKINVEKSQNNISCENCGKSIDSDSLYCAHCGAKIQ